MAKLPLQFNHSFFGANLIALQKKDGGVRPIAVENSLCHLVVAKVASSKVVCEMSDMLAPT